MYSFILPLAAGYALDLIFGDPRNIPHPVCAIGYAVSKSEKFIRRIFPKTAAGEKAGGAALAVWIVFLSGAAPFIILYAAEQISVYLKLAAESVMCWQCLAAKSLRDESMKVYKALETGDIEASRKAVSMIVGRDTAELDFDGVRKAAVETVAENASDGVAAPAIFMAIGGVVGGFIYKAVNTMDSMVGYKNEKYINFGKAAAKADDIFNFLPSRITAVLMIVSAALLGYDWKNAFRIFKRDRLKHASPNSAQTESVCAGALGVRLAGDAWYFGKLYKKDFLGDPYRKIENEDIIRANRLMYTAVFLLMVLISAVYAVLGVNYA